MKNCNISLTINTVICKENIDYIMDLGNFLCNYPIDNWRIFKFMPLRETAQRNKEEFEISDEQFEYVKENLKKFKYMNIEYRQEKDMEDKYILLIANGDIVMTENGKDIKKGNAIYDSIVDLIN